MRHLALALLLAACGNDSALPDGGGSPIVDAPPTDGFAPLISTTWSLDSSTEKYLCVRLTVTQDTYVKAIRPVAPVGTHHAVLMLGPGGQVADGTTECDSSLTEPAIYASGVGTEEIDFPDGIGLHLLPGQQLFLNLHLFNVSDGTITGTSGVEFLPADPSEIVHPAGTVLAGKMAGLVVVPGTSDQVGTCTTPAGTTMFGVAPHMHLLGSHMNVTYDDGSGNAPTTVLDTDYSFDDQKFRMFQPITTVAGGKYTVTCSYVNTTGKTVPFGESTEDEMCFAMTYVYPPPSQPTCTR